MVKETVMPLRLILLMTWLPLVWLVPPGHAAPGAVTAIAQPSEVTLTPGSRMEGRLIVSNAGTAAARVVVRPVAVDPSIAVVVLNPRTLLPAGGSTPLAFTIKRKAEGAAQASEALFVVEWTTGGSAPVRQVVVTSLSVRPAPSPALLKATIEPELDTLNENRPGETQLLLTNPRETQVVIKSILARSPRGVSTSVTCPYNLDKTLTVKPGTSAIMTDCQFKILGREQQVVPLVFETENAVAPGTRAALIKVNAEEGSQPSKESVIASTTFTVDVFAESEILKMLNVPIFLLLPGFLVVVTLWFLFGTLGPGKKTFKALFPDGILEKAGVAAILSLAISFLMAWAYPWLTDLVFPGYSRDYLRAYGFKDFYYVFSYSLTICFVMWVAVCIGVFVARKPWHRTREPGPPKTV